MVLDKNQVSTLLQFVATVTPDGMTCDGCLEQVPELAESQMGSIPLDEVMLKVKNHIDNCPCCAGEYESFLVALNEIEEPVR